MSAFCEPLEKQSLPDQRAPAAAGAAGLVHSRFEQELQSFRPSRAGLLLWCRLQGFAKSAHPWLISSHPFGVEELRPMGGAEYVTVFMLVCTKLQRPSRAPGLIWKIRYRIYEIVYLQ